MEQQQIVEVFADISCPFTQVGLHRWFARRDEMERFDVRLHVRAWPLELVNGAALTGAAIAEKVAALSETFPDLFAGFSPDSFPSTTLPALQLSNAAAGVDLATGERVARRLRDLLFMDGVDISDPTVLAAVAAEHGVPAAGADDEHSVEADLEEGRRRGVIGSPHYFATGFDSFCPGLDIAHVGERLDVTSAGEQFDAFMDRCFGEIG